MLRKHTDDRYGDRSDIAPARFYLAELTQWRGHLASKADKWVLGLLSPAGHRGRLIILTFHRILSRTDPLLAGEPDIQEFRRWMTWLRDYCNVIALPEAAQRLSEGTLPERAACITFDDGYANNLELAAPVLQEMGLPATFFITSGAIEAGVMWNDQVIEAVRFGSGSLDLKKLELGTVPISTLAEKTAAIGRILDKLKYRSVGERAPLIDTIMIEAGHIAARQMMTEEDVAKLASQGFDIGAHTVSHPILAAEPLASARREIFDSCEWVARITNSKPRSFAYPNGRQGIDYNADHVKAVAEAGFQAAVTTEWGAAGSSSNRFELPRISLWEHDRKLFRNRLAKAYLRSFLTFDSAARR